MDAIPAAGETCETRLFPDELYHTMLPADLGQYTL